MLVKKKKIVLQDLKKKILIFINDHKFILNKKLAFVINLYNLITILLYCIKKKSIVVVKTIILI